MAQPLAGFETAAQTGQPIVGATVSYYTATAAHPNGTAALGTTTTDGNGYWEFANVSDELYYDVKVVYTVSSVTYTWWYKGLSKFSAPIFGSSNNLLCNPGFEIWQRGTSGFTSSGTFGPDGWKVLYYSTSTLTLSREVTEIDKASPGSPSQYSCKMAHVFVAGATGLSTTILNEMVTQLQTHKLTVAARVKSGVVGACQVEIFDGVDTTLGSLNTGTGWETLTCTHSVNAAATQIRITIKCSAGSNTSVYVDNCVAVVGAVAPPYRPFPAEDDWARCQRYYEQFGGETAGASLIGGTYAGAGIVQYNIHPYRTVRPSAPTVTKNGTWAVTNCGQPIVAGTGTREYAVAVTTTALGLAYSAPDSTDDLISIIWSP